MFTVGSFGFILFAALLAGLWRVTPQPRRWQLMLAASLVFYLSLDWQGCLLLCLMTLLVWQAALHLRGSPRWFYVGLAGALAPLTLLRLRPAALLLGQAFSLRIWDCAPPHAQHCGRGWFWARSSRASCASRASASSTSSDVQPSKLNASRGSTTRCKESTRRSFQRFMIKHHPII